MAKIKDKVFSVYVATGPCGTPMLGLFGKRQPTIWSLLAEFLDMTKEEAISRGYSVVPCDIVIREPKPTKPRK